MSGLHHRVGELERRQGRCPTCAKRPALFEAVTPSGSHLPPDTSPDDDEPQPLPDAPGETAR